MGQLYKDTPALFFSNLKITTFQLTLNVGWQPKLGKIVFTYQKARIQNFGVIGCGGFGYIGAHPTLQQK